MATTISGKVTAPEGSPVPDAVVELHNASDDVLTQIQVDEEGRYRFHVTEGLWQLKAWDPHGRRGEGKASVSNGEDRNLNVSIA